MKKISLFLFVINVLSLVLYLIYIYFLLNNKYLISGNHLVSLVFLFLFFSTIIGLIYSYKNEIKFHLRYYILVFFSPIISFIILLLIDGIGALYILGLVLFSTFENYKPIAKNEPYFITNSFGFMTQDIFDLKENKGFYSKKIGIFHHSFELLNSDVEFEVIDSNTKKYIKLYDKGITTFIYEIEINSSS